MIWGLALFCSEVRWLEKYRQHKLMCGFTRKNYTFYGVCKDIGEDNKCPGFRMPCFFFFFFFQSQRSSRKEKAVDFI